MFHVVIAGGGPAGLWLASHLKALGVTNFLVIEKAYPGAKVICGGAVALRVVKSIKDKIRSLNLTDRVLLKFNKKNIKLKVTNIAVFRREQLQMVLAEDIGEDKILTSVSVKDYEEKDDYVEIFLENGDKIKARYFVIATGAASTLLKNKDLGFHISRNKYIIGRRCIFEGDHTFKKDTLIFNFTEGIPGYRWVFPFKGGINVGIVLYDLNQRIEFDKILGEYKEYGNFKGDGVCDSAPIPIELAKHFATNRVAVLGNSAGMVNAVTAGGMTAIYHFSIILAQSIKIADRYNLPLSRIYEGYIKLSPVYHFIRLMSGYVRKRKRLNTYGLFSRFFSQFSILAVIKRFNYM